MGQGARGSGGGFLQEVPHGRARAGVPDEQPGPRRAAGAGELPAAAGGRAGLLGADRLVPEKGPDGAGPASPGARAGWRGRRRRRRRRRGWRRLRQGRLQGRRRRDARRLGVPGLLVSELRAQRLVPPVRHLPARARPPGGGGHAHCPYSPGGARGAQRARGAAGGLDLLALRGPAVRPQPVLPAVRHPAGAGEGRVGASDKGRHQVRHGVGRRGGPDAAGCGRLQPEVPSGRQDLRFPAGLVARGAAAGHPGVQDRPGAAGLLRADDGVHLEECRADEEFELLQGGGARPAASAQPPLRQPAPRGQPGVAPAGPYAGEMFQVPCRFFLRGDCNRGAACPYQHTAPSHGAGPAAPSAGQGVWGGPIKARGSRSDGGSVEAFLAKYPVDGRAREFLLAAPPEVRSQVVQEFRPRVEGEADYSGLLMAFTRRCLGGAAPAPAIIPAYPSGRGDGRGDARWADRREASAAEASGADRGHRRPTESAASGPGKEGCEAFRERYPMDDRAYEFLSSSSAEVVQKVINTFAPRRPNDRDFSPAVMAYTRACRKEMGDDGPLQSTSSGGGASARAADIDIAELDKATDAFFDRYPCDNRCVAFLKALEPQVCDRVLREFIPRREGDSDYSAIVMSFAKSCMGAGPPAERERPWAAAERQPPWAAGEPPFKRQRNYN
ncbi:unnamed protein product [Prorocentrum cordatum]|uniref:C3H1-type domain-containing protein n=1 Tax=Prorocentrum cordatum TaxID=2364126 RepID=A0ABN9YCQ1_9DINO|nr:unnamed protein product [Polarella glacialis]